MSRVLMALAASCLVCAGAVGARALGAGTRVEVRGVQVGDLPEPRESARRRLAWEVRKRTSIETVLRPSRSRLDDPAIFESPLLYWAG
ncbi:MAG TPA: hypothetical protein RMH26_22420, partial [Polyangiaceae bacterium LLY-WYZ-15_(1-7)]|nr:hypothetical protein [Polyangiaceae bacterium LLY-WYZ-15_(1-7)]